MSEHWNQTAFEAMFTSVEELDNVEVEAELRSLGVDPCIAVSMVNNAIDRAVAKSQPPPPENGSRNRAAKEGGMFRDFDEPMFAGRSASLPSVRKPKKDSSLN